MSYKFLPGSHSYPSANGLQNKSLEQLGIPFETTNEVGSACVTLGPWCGFVLNGAGEDLW